MKSPLLRTLRTARFEEQATLQPDLARALRATIAFIGPLVVSIALGKPHAAAFAAPAGLTLALTDLRGPYRERFAIAITMSLAMIGATVLGVLVEPSLALAVAAMGAVALLGGVWRHLSADYGPGLTSATALLFLIGSGQPGGWAAVEPLLGPMALGCGLAVLLQMAAWFTRPQHPLRAVVADVWVATADLLLVLRPEAATPTPEAIATKERTLRTALDRAIATLMAAGNRRHSALLAHLTAMRQAASRLSAWAEAFHTAQEPLRSQPGQPHHFPTIDSLLNALATMARAVAVALISHRPRHFAAVAVRVQRCLHLARVLDDKIAHLPAPVDPLFEQLRILLQQLADALPALRDELEATTDHAARARSPLRVPQLNALSPRSLTAWVDTAPRTDPVLVRHAIRMALLTMAAVAVYKYFQIERGYWIALTILVVLQPDYGATRKRAGQRIVGTLAGATVASGLLWISMPPLLLLTLATVMAFGFAYLVRQNYRWAVFFVTVMLVLITETATTVTIQLPLMRLGSTVAGGAVALLAALFLWPSWERERFPALLATALRANGAYLRAVAEHLVAGRPLVGEAIVAKRAAETANAEAGASLEKMLAEPTARHANIAQAGALTAYAQRLTRAVTLLAVQLRQGEPEPPQPLLAVVTAATTALDTLATAVAQEQPLATAPALLEPAGVLGGAPVASTRAEVLAVPLAKALTEIRAMVLALREEA